MIRLARQPMRCARSRQINGWWNTANSPFSYQPSYRSYTASLPWLPKHSKWIQVALFLSSTTGFGLIFVFLEGVGYYSIYIFTASFDYSQRTLFSLLLILSSVYAVLSCKNSGRTQTWSSTRKKPAGAHFIFTQPAAKKLMTDDESEPDLTEGLSSLQM